MKISAIATAVIGALVVGVGEGAAKVLGVVFILIGLALYAAAMRARDGSLVARAVIGVVSVLGVISGLLNADRAFLSILLNLAVLWLLFGNKEAREWYASPS